MQLSFCMVYIKQTAELRPSIICYELMLQFKTTTSDESFAI